MSYTQGIIDNPDADFFHDGDLSPVRVEDADFEELYNDGLVLTREQAMERAARWDGDAEDIVYDMREEDIIAGW